jgi:hypothetical protein
MGETQIRPLTGSDFEAAVALDARIAGQPRRGYFEKRLAAALRDPKRHLQLAAAEGPRQMIENLAAIHVERLETEVAEEDAALRRFLHAFGFRPAPRLPFERAP